MSRRLVAAFAVAALALGGCTAAPTESRESTDPTAPTTAASFESDRTAGVQSLLDTWATAVRAEDTTTLRGLFDAGADPAFVAREIERSRNLQGVPLSDFGYEIVDGPETPVPSELADSLAATDVWAPDVVLRYAYTDADVGPTRRDVTLVVARRGDTWSLVSDADLPQYGRTTWRGPWDSGPVVTRAVPTGDTTSLVIGHPEQQTLIDGLAADLPAAVVAVTDFAGIGWSRRAVVTVTGSDAEFTSSANGSVLTDVAASTIADPVRGGFVTGQRIVFGPSAADRLTESTRRTVLQHELTHVALRSITTDGSPLWLLEGVADYSGYRDSGMAFTDIAPTLSAVVRVGGPPTVLPLDSDFAAGGSRGAIAYESAWSVAAYIAERFGEPALLQLYRALAVGPSNPTTVERALGATLGLPTSDFLDAWGAWVVEQAGPR